MNRTRLLILTVHVAILLRLMLAADAALRIALRMPIAYSRAASVHQPLIAWLIHHHINAYARRNALRDHLASTDPRGSLGDEFLGLIMVFGLAYIGSEIFEDAHRAYTEHLAQAFSSLAMSTH
jgi:hypothetical protein